MTQQKSSNKSEVQLTVAETDHGPVTMKDWKEFFSFSWGVPGMVLYMFISIAAAVTQMAPTYVLSVWTSLPFEKQQSETIWWKLFLVTTVVFIVLSLLRSIVFTVLVLNATTNMHSQMAWKVLRSKIQFFDSNPIGRITSRFTKDMMMLDVLFAGITVFVTQGVLRSIIVAITVSATNPLLLVACFLGAGYMYWIMKTAKRSMSDAQKMEQMYQAPINSYL